jgi:hypothetical protein
MALPTPNSDMRRFDASAPIDLFTGDPGLNKLTDAINILRRRVDDIERTGGGRPPDRKVRFRIMAMANDYLTCRKFNGDAVASEEIIVAKGPYLRHSLLFATGAKRYIGVDSIATVNTQTVIASKTGEDDETWRVVPGYAVGQELYATFAPRGGTGLVVGGVRVMWLEEEHGRAWAQEQPS